MEKTLESPLDCKEIQAVHPKGDQSWVFIGRTDAKAETPILWPPHVKSWLIGKDPDAGRDWGQAEKGTTEDEMAGWHHWLEGHEFEWTLGVGDGQGGLVCCSPWGHKESDTTERLNWTELNWSCGHSQCLPCWQKDSDRLSAADRMESSLRQSQACALQGSWCEAGRFPPGIDCLCRPPRTTMETGCTQIGLKADLIKISRLGPFTLKLGITLRNVPHT